MPKAPSEPVAAAASHSGRLKYADPRDLPSFPSSGLSSDGAAASAAASLGWANQKSPEPWRPDKSSSASAAAVLAKDYKSSAIWEPSGSSSGANKAAMLAVGSAGAALKQQAQQASGEKKVSQDTWGNSAANQAFHANRMVQAESTDLAAGGSAATQAFNINKGLVKPPEPSSPLQADRSLAAAKGAMSSSRLSTAASSAAAANEARRVEANAATNALNGATLAHRNSMIAKAPIEDVGAVPITTMTRNMFTSNPPVKPEVDEKANNDRLHQTAVELAKKMYLQQQKMLDQTKEAHDEDSSSAPAGTYLNLQDAAYKQAQERLAKLHDEHQQSREYQEYYGNTSSPKKRFSVSNKLRHRSLSDPDLDDRQRSEQIRDQMSMFSTKLSQVDKEKREKDREALMAAAQRNVKARLQGMDEKAHHDGGKRNSRKLTEWELKAQQAAQSRSDTRTENRGKIDIGGGKFMDAEEINAIAAKKMQPLLDDINEKAEVERERVATLKLEEEAKREEIARQKARDREAKDISKKLKEQEKQEEKAKKQRAKDEEKARKEEEKAAKAEQQRLAKEEKRKSKLGPAPSPKAPEESTNQPAAEDQATTAEDQDADVENPSRAPALDYTHHAAEDAVGHKEVAGDNESAIAATPIPDATTENTENARRKSVDSASSPKPKSKVKGWIQKRFSRTKSMVEDEDNDKSSGAKRRSFLGGSSKKERTKNESAASLEKRSSSMRDVVLAGKPEDDEAERTTSARDEIEADSRGVSLASTPAVEEERNLEANEDRVEEKKNLEVPKPLEDPVGRTSTSSLTRDSRFKEEMDR